MKVLKLISLVIIAQAAVLKAGAQNINWRSFTQNDNQFIVNLNLGWDYGLTAGAGFGYRIKTIVPLVASAQISVPSGKKLVDDFKSKLEMQAELLNYHNISVTLKAAGVFRRTENNVVRMSNFGSEFTLVAGYYKNRWYAAAEAGFDKAITTHIVHSELLRKDYPGIQDGWYIPTGGNAMFGIQGGYSFKKSEINLKLGRTYTQYLDRQPLIPYYMQLGFNRYL